MSARFALVVLFAGTIAASACGTHGRNRREVRVALTGDGVTWLPVHLAHSLGYDREEGIDIAVSEVGSMSKSMEALMGGSADVAAGALAQAIQAAAEGADARCFLVLYTRPILTLAVAPPLSTTVRTIADLKGRTVGVSAPGSATHQFLNFLLSTHGLSAGDVSVVAIGTAATSVAALEHAKVDAAMLVGSAISTVERRNAGVTFLADTRSDDGARRALGTPVFPNTALMARPHWLEADSDTASRFVRAVKKAMRWMASETPGRVRAQMPESIRMPDAEADLTSIHDNQLLLSVDGAVPAGAPEAVRKYVAVSSEKVRGARIDLERVYTNVFVARN